jgi:hypothetical protein
MEGGVRPAAPRTEPDDGGDLVANDGANPETDYGPQRRGCHPADEHPDVVRWSMDVDAACRQAGAPRPGHQATSDETEHEANHSARGELGDG